MTYFFTIKTRDIYNNIKSSYSNGTTVSIIAVYNDHTSYVSPIGVADISNWIQIYGQNIAGVAENNKDGTYTGQFTVYRAGNYILNVKVNDIHVVSSPFSSGGYLIVSPSDIYAPNCIVDSLTTTVTAGTTTSF